MGKRGILRIIAVVAVASLVFGVSTAAGSGRDLAPQPVAAASDPDPQNGPADGDRGWTGVATDRGRVKPPPQPGAFAMPSPNHAPDVPGQPVVSAREPAGPIVTPAGVSADEVARIRQAIAAGGLARVTVTTSPPSGLSSMPESADRHRAAITRSLDALRDRVRGSGAREVSRITAYPWASYAVSGAGLDALLAEPSVTSVTLDAQVSLALAESTAIVRSTQLNQAGTRGDGWTGSPVGPSEVVIIDSGVDNDHNAFRTGRVVAEACFSASSNCPGGGSVETGADSAENCTYAPRCSHGTHTASIAAGTAFAGGHAGVAPGAGIVAIQVGSLSATGWTAMISDINLALQYALDRRNGGANVTAVNLSLHIPGFVRAAVCDVENGNFAATQALAANLQSAGVAVVAAAGNDNQSGVSYPACLTSVFAVSATNDADQPAAFTNSGALTNWWAPGVNIDAATPGTDTHAIRAGTSTAAPHVSGAFALLRQCVDGNGVQISNNTAVTRLNATGLSVSDNGASRKRINVLEAAAGLVNNNDFANAETIPSGANFNDFDFNICSDTEQGEPAGPFSLDNGVWWNWTPSATGTATISTDDGGGNVTTFDTTLTVFTGSTLTTLKVIASDDDGGVGTRSLVTVPVNAGTTYRIKVDGFAGGTGLLNLHVENNAPPTCQGVAATIVGYAIDDTIVGTAGADVIVAGPGNDTITARGGNDRVCGDSGDDTIGTGSGDDVALGGAGADDITGSEGNDTLVGNPGGGSTDDVGDVIRGGPGNDLLDGWVGNDRLFGGPGNDDLRGEDGTDAADYSTAGGAVTVDLVAGTATGDGNDTFVEVENVIGSPFNDVLNGDGLVNVLSGLTGNDTIRGRGQNDLVRGYDGTDSLFGGTGNDTVRGGPGNDTVRGEEGNDALHGESGTDTCNGGPGVDTAAPNCETVLGVP